MLTQNRLKELLHYDPETGVFTWIANNKRIQKGCVAGHEHANGYIRIAIDGYQYKAHRLAWLYMTGESPQQQVDHINNQKHDNRWLNLRLASNAENSLNKPIGKRNTSGVKGVHWSIEKERWLAQLTIQGKKVQIGSFDDIELAQLAIEEARNKFHGKFSNHGRH